MATLEHDLKLILELEREGGKRLAAAQEEARQLLEAGRAEARRVREAGERRIAQEREERVREAEEEIATRLRERQRLFQEEEERLRVLAGQNRPAAVARILSWLAGGG